jgi:AraC-like DNA-binding protein
MLRHVQGAGHVFRERRASADLADHVCCVWAQSVDADLVGHESRAVPNGCGEIAYVLGERAPMVIGPTSGPTSAPLGPGTRAVGVRLRHGIAGGLLGVAAHELVDRRIGLDELWGSRALVLAEQLSETASLAAAATELERAVGGDVAGLPPRDPVIVEAVARLQPWRRTRVRQLAGELFLSERQLRRRLVETVGFAPKALQRMLRIQGFLALTAGGDPVSLAAATAALGYSDQAHLTRECIELTGATPRVFVRETREQCGPRHDHGATYAVARRALGPLT